MKVGLIILLSESFTMDAKNPPKGGLDHDAIISSTKVVAGVGFEPTTFRL